MIMRRGEKGGIVIEGLLILIGLGLIVKAVIVGGGTYKFIHSTSAQSVPGVIVSITDHGFTSSVDYTLPSGERRNFNQRGLFLNLSPGQQIPVIHNPDRVGAAVIDKADVIWFMSFIYGFPGLIIFFFGMRKWMARSL